jgi:ferredoxin-NADP reductase
VVASTASEAQFDLTIARKELVADGVAVLDLCGQAPLPAWQPGAHVDLLLDVGVTRQYSLCGDPADHRTWRIAVLREPQSRGGSARIHDALTEGSPVRARGPRNHFPFEPAGRYLFIAGGIGITPILPMLVQAEHAEADWALIYGGRTRSAMAFAGELAARYPGRVQLRPQDETGLLDLDTLLGQPRADTLVYCCGPELLLAAAQSRCAHWPAGVLRVERFAPAKEEGVENAFDIELARSGLTLTVPPGRSVLATVAGAGIDVLSSCTEGTCGTCETTVLAGLPDHRDSVLTPAERETSEVMMICVSRAVSPRLVLDL